ncbi:hypothetical protein EVAR_10080_1 [Eumeta japonica]|uniref:Uncharacterized protein n=1 Tax=Eumeta variegata TaxID=151549 RepID=A0A4C1TR94_EUMVA|nr:hypothetical protein EVAR_10080_1 [Eumeta japonica]
MYVHLQDEKIDISKSVSSQRDTCGERKLTHYRRQRELTAPVGPRVNEANRRYLFGCPARARHQRYLRRLIIREKKRGGHRPRPAPAPRLTDFIALGRLERYRLTYTGFHFRDNLVDLEPCSTPVHVGREPLALRGVVADRRRRPGLTTKVLSEERSECFNIT